MSITWDLLVQWRLCQNFGILLYENHIYTKNKITLFSIRHEIVVSSRIWGSYSMPIFFCPFIRVKILYYYINILYNILKGIIALVTVYLDTKHCGLQQYNGRVALPQRVGKTVGGEWGCLFIGMHLALKGWLGRK